MTVARRNRRWTPELSTRLVNEVSKEIKKCGGIVHAFQKVAPAWGASPATVANVYYKNRFKPIAAAKVVVKGKVNNKSAVGPSVQEAIAVLKKLGVKVTLTF